jgi:hypothetical protein
MSKTEGLEVLLTDKQQRSLVNRSYRRRIAATIENRQFGDGVAGAIHTQDMFPASRRALEDPNVTRLDDV